MNTSLLKNNPELKQAFEFVLSNEDTQLYISDIIKLILEDNLSRTNIKIILDNYNIKGLHDIKLELIDLLLFYIKRILNDHVITANEKRNVEILKILFKIREGDFIKYRPFEIGDILHRQFETLYIDNHIDSNEAIYNFELQDMFDLSYQQFDKFKEKEIKEAIKRGADILKLDTALSWRKI